MTARRAAASLLAVVAVAALAAPGPARAEWKPSGSLTAAMLVRPSVGYSRCGDTGKPCDGTVYGGGVWVDLQQPIGPLRLGGVIGLFALGGAGDETRVFAPLGASLSLVAPWRPTTLSLDLRGGLWSGATNAGFRAGGWFDAGARVHFGLDARVGVAVGLDAWVLTGYSRAIAIVPSIGIVWRLGAPAEGNDADAGSSAAPASDDDGEAGASE